MMAAPAGCGTSDYGFASNVICVAAFAVAAVVSSSLFRSFAMPAKVHRIGGVPHVMILTHSGKQLGEISGGGMNADAYVSKLKDIMRNKGNDVGPEAASLFAR